MQPSAKAVIQNPEGRGFLYGNTYRLSNLQGEVTYNVTLGHNKLGYYSFLGQLKFQTLEDAQEYVDSIGATPGVVTGKEYYAITRQEGCSSDLCSFFSVK